MKVAKLSISLDAALAAEIREAAKKADVSVSAWIAEAVRPRLRSEALRRFLDEYEQEFGPFTEEGLEQARIDLGLTEAPSSADAAG